jgi:hypothetical protein
MRGARERARNKPRPRCAMAVPGPAGAAVRRTLRAGNGREDRRFGARRTRSGVGGGATLVHPSGTSSGGAHGMGYGWSASGRLIMCVALVSCAETGSAPVDAAVSGRDARPDRWDGAGDARPRPLGPLDARGGGGSAAGTDALSTDAAARSIDGTTTPADADTAPGRDARPVPPTPDAAPDPEPDAVSAPGPEADAARPSPRTSTSTRTAGPPATSPPSARPSLRVSPCRGRAPVRP